MDKDSHPPFGEIITQLADPRSYRLVCHEHRQGEPLDPWRQSIDTR